MVKQIYLDNAATTKVDPAVLKAMLPYFTEKYGNASSSHAFGGEAKLELEKARAVIAKSINASPEEIIFTSGGTESNNLALKGLFLENKEKRHIITTKIEHDSVLEVTKWMEKYGGKVSYLNVDKDGFVDLIGLRQAIQNDTLVVSIIHGNNEIGTIQNLEEIGKICKEKGVYLHTDACQSYTKSEIDVVKQNISLMTLNAHKIHGPKGVGALYLKKGIKIMPLMHGGGHESHMRSGTENIPGIIGFAKSVEIADKKNIKKISDMRDYLIKKILTIPKTRLNGVDGDKRLCNNVNVSFTNIEGEAIASHLEGYGISVSTGSACASHSLKKSHVLKAIGLNDLEINSSIRISLSKFTKKEEIDYFIKKLKEIIITLRKISPFN